MAIGNHNYHGIFEDPRSGEYDRLSEAYARYWSAHDPNAEHYLKVRTETARLYLRLRDTGCKPESGVAVVCGPGFAVAENRDFEPTFVETQLADHPALVIADYSRAILQDAYRSLSEASTRLSPKVLCARREFSSGLSVRFDQLMMDGIDPIDSDAEFLSFMDSIRDPDEVLERMQKVKLPKGKFRGGESDVLEVTHDDVFDFREITNNIAPVRFIICNLLLAGMLATTERAFREKLLEIKPRYEESFEEDDFRSYLQIWHELVTHIHKEISMNFIRGALDHNPEATLSIIVDENTNYGHGVGQVPRWDLKSIHSGLVRDGIKMVIGSQWEQDDSNDVPSHTHHILHVNATKVRSQPEAEIMQEEVSAIPAEPIGQVIS